MSICSKSACICVDVLLIYVIRYLTININVPISCQNLQYEAMVFGLILIKSLFTHFGNFLGNGITKKSTISYLSYQVKYTVLKLWWCQLKAPLLLTQVLLNHLQNNKRWFQSRKCISLFYRPMISRATFFFLYFLR